MVKKYVPKKGDVIWLDFSPTRGHEQDGNRPAIVISPDEYNKQTGLVLVCPVTSIVKKYNFEVEIFGGKVSGVILSNHIRSVDWEEREVKFIEKIKSEVFDEVIKKLETLINL